MLSEMKSLIKLLNRASELYYSGKESFMTDKEYDELSDRLAELEHKSGTIFPDSPSINVGYESGSPLVKVEHEYPSLSLNKTKDVDELIDWMGDRSCVLSWKCDGLTVILTYDDGKLVRAATRGNGSIGEDITRNAVNLENIPLRINDRRHIVIRGEAVMPYAAFDAINETLPDEKKYKNPRNMAAGAVKVLSPEKTANYGVRFIPFDLVNAIELGYSTMSAAFDFISELGMETVEWCEVDRTTVAKVIKQREKAVTALPYPTDGLVIIYNSLELCQDLGATRKYPRYAMAFKWEDKLATTILRSIEWSVAKTGLISPVAVFDPVELEGTTIRRANLHNINIARELQLGIGDRIRVYKANMIIPQIYDDLDKTNNLEVITRCPVCNKPIEQRLGVNGKSIFIHCVNDDCPAKQ